MIFVYGNYLPTATIASTPSGAAFVTPAAGAGLFSGRTGAGQKCTWAVGAGQTTASNVVITITPTAALDASPVYGMLGVFNVQGLPAGTKVVVNGITQRLVAGERGELNAMFLPQIAGATITVTIFNDVNGVASIASGQQFYIGQIYTGRAMNLPLLLDTSFPTIDLQDPTAFNRSAGLQLYQVARKGVRAFAGTLGRFTMLQARGGSQSNLNNGNLSGGTIDVQSLRGLLTISPICALCDMPSAGFGGNTATVNGMKYDVNIMQQNFMLARLTAAGIITPDQPPFFTWSPAAQEAT